MTCSASTLAFAALGGGVTTVAISIMVLVAAGWLRIMVKIGDDDLTP